MKRLAVLIPLALLFMVLFCGTALADNASWSITAKDCDKVYVFDTSNDFGYVNIWKSDMDNKVWSASFMNWESSNESVVSIYSRLTNAPEYDNASNVIGYSTTLKIRGTGTAVVTCTYWLKTVKYFIIVNQPEKEEYHYLVTTVDAPACRYPVTEKTDYAAYCNVTTKIPAGTKLNSRYSVINYTNNVWYKVYLDGNYWWVYSKYVNILVSNITLNTNSVSLDLITNKTTKLSATVAPADAANKNYTWSSSNTSVATVSSDGTVTGVGVGTAYIYATASDGSGTKGKCKVSVTQSVTYATSIALNKSSLSMVVGNTSYLTYTVSPSTATNKEVTWSSSNTSVATVSEGGLVKAVGTGSATIYCRANGANPNANLYATCSVTVGSNAVSFTWTTGSTKYGTVYSEVKDVTGTTAVFPYYCTTKNVDKTLITEVGVVYTNLKSGARVVCTENTAGKFSNEYTYFYNYQGYSVKLIAGMQYSYYYYAVYQGVTYTSDVKTFWTTGATTGGLDVNFMLDGVYSGVGGYGTFDVYINGVLVADDVSDYCASHNVYDEYIITDIKPVALYTYGGVYSGYLRSRIESGVTADTILIFNQNPKYVLHFDAGSGSCNLASATVQIGSTDNFDVSWQNPSRTGYTFQGWYTASGTQVYNEAGYCVNEGTFWSGNTWQYTGDLWLYARWIDPEPPVISTVQVVNQTRVGYDLIISATDNTGSIAKIQVATWTDYNGQDDLPSDWGANSAYAATYGSDGYWHAHVNTSDHNNEEGWYVNHVYAWDNSGNHTAYGINAYIDRIAPVISDVQVKDLTADGFTVTCTVTDNYAASFAEYAVWSEPDGQDDMTSQVQICV